MSGLKRKRVDTRAAISGNIYFFSYELFLDSEARKIGITRGELEGGGVVAREAHRRLSTDVCHGVVFLSYRHVYEHLFVHYDGITRLDGIAVGGNGS